MFNMAYNYSKSEYVEDYVMQMTRNIKRIHPEWDEDLIHDYVFVKTEKQIQNPIVEMDNNYIHEHKTATMLSVIDWTRERKPILAGNATFYKNQHEAINPIANMLDGMLKRRKAFKKEMFKIEDATSSKYKGFDLKQQNEKINCNSYYGASGMPASAFYSLWSGPELARNYAGPHTVMCA